MHNLKTAIIAILSIFLLSAVVSAQNTLVKPVIYNKSVFEYGISQLPSALAIKKSVDDEFAAEENKIESRRADHSKRDRAYSKKVEEISESRTFTASEGEKFQDQVAQEIYKLSKESDLITAAKNNLTARKSARLKELLAPIDKKTSDFEAEFQKHYQVKLFHIKDELILNYAENLEYTDQLLKAYEVFASTNRIPENLKIPEAKVALLSPTIFPTNEDEDALAQIENKDFYEKLTKYVNSTGYTLILKYDKKIPDGFSADMDITNKVTASVNSSKDYERGVMALNMGGYDSAIDFFSKAIQSDPNNAGAFANRARAYAAKENYDFAVADFTKAISMNSESINMIFIYNYRAKIYSRQQKYDLAMKDFNKSIEIERDNSEAFEGRAMVNYKLKQFDTAIKDFTEAIKLKSDSSSAYHHRGHTHQALKNFDSAISDFTKAMEFTRDSSHLYYDRANTYKMKENLDLAISDLNQAIQMKPDFTNAFLLRSQILCSKGNKTLAAQDEEKIISLGKTVEKRCM